MILHYTLFQDNEHGHGAFKRSFQISELIASMGEEVIRFSKYPNNKNDINIFKRLKIAHDYYSYFGVKEFNINKIRFKALDIILWKKWLEGVKEQNDKLTLVYELCYNADYSLIWACHELGIKIVGIPHNLESLVYGQTSHFDGTLAPNWFQEEIKLLSLFTTIYTISREEQWLLGLYGIESSYLPFIPSTAVTENCLEIKKLREKSTKSYFLSLGTAINTPTMQGFKELIHFYKNLEIEEHLVIGGFETELLHPFLPKRCENIKILGSLDQTQLKEEFVNCIAVIIHQIPTTGSLTKIPELLLSGIPVIGNSAAARNYFDTSGVHVYQSISDLKLILKENNFSKDFVFELNDKNEAFISFFK